MWKTDASVSGYRVVGSCGSVVRRSREQDRSSISSSRANARWGSRTLFARRRLRRVLLAAALIVTVAPGALVAESSDTSQRPLFGLRAGRERFFEAGHAAEDSHAEAFEDGDFYGFLAWDLDLETPRFIGPVDPISLFTLPVGTDYDRAVLAMRFFVWKNSETLGIENSDLGDPTVTAFGDGFAVRASQLLDGLPMRGSHLILRLDDSFALVWAAFRLVRAPIGTVAPVFAESDIRERLRADGIDSPRYVELVQGFFDTVDEAHPIWVAGAMGEAGGVELFYSAVDGERLAERTTRLGWQGGQEGVADDGVRRLEIALDGFCPPVGDRFAVPSDLPAEPVPLAGVEVTYSFEGRPDVSPQTVAIPDDGRLLLDGTYPDEPLTVDVRLLPEGLDPEFAAYEHALLRDGDGDGHVEMTFNSERTLSGSAHLLAAIHIAKARAAVEASLARSGIARVLPDGRRVPFDIEIPEARILVDRYEHAYDSLAGRITLGSDERSPDARDVQGRLAKLVPTVVYHEFAHHVFRTLTGSDFDRGLNEGIADAMAALISGQSTVGFAGESEPNTDPWARDLALDTLAIDDLDDIGEARRAVAGALWSVREYLADAEEEPLSPQERDEFVLDLLIRILAAHSAGDESDAAAGQALTYDPFLGLAFFLEADTPGLGGDLDPHAGAKRRAAIFPFAARGLVALSFVRGDANSTGRVEIDSAIQILRYLFFGVELDCADAADADDSGRISLTDAIVVLEMLFRGGPPPVRPFPRCGTDITPNDGLGCLFGACPLFWN